MRKHMLRKRLQQIVQLMVFQYCVVLFLILCGATIYGIRTDNWLAAVERAEVLSGAVTFFMAVAYLRARNLVKAYSDSLHSSEGEVFMVGGAESPAVPRFGVVVQGIDMPYV